MRRNAYLLPYCDMLHVINLTFYICLYNIYLKFHFQNKPSISDEVPRKARKIQSQICVFDPN